jgi:hypothetical protein
LKQDASVVGYAQDYKGTASPYLAVVAIRTLKLKIRDFLTGTTPASPLPLARARERCKGSCSLKHGPQWTRDSTRNWPVPSGVRRWSRVPQLLSLRKPSMFRTLQSVGCGCARIPLSTQRYHNPKAATENITTFLPRPAHIGRNLTNDSGAICSVSCVYLHRVRVTFVSSVLKFVSPQSHSPQLLPPRSVIGIGACFSSSGVRRFD